MWLAKPRNIFEEEIDFSAKFSQEMIVFENWGKFELKLEIGDAMG